MFKRLIKCFIKDNNKLQQMFLKSPTELISIHQMRNLKPIILQTFSVENLL